MTKSVTDFKVPTVRRAIRLAHAQGLAVQSYDILQNGTVHVELRPYQITPSGEVRTLDEDAA